MIKKKFELFESKFELELEKPSLWKFKSYFEKINIKTKAETSFVNGKKRKEYLKNARSNLIL